MPVGQFPGPGEVGLGSQPISPPGHHPCPGLLDVGLPDRGAARLGQCCRVSDATVREVPSPGEFGHGGPVAVGGAGRGDPGDEGAAPERLEFTEEVAGRHGVLQMDAGVAEERQGQRPDRVPGDRLEPSDDEVVEAGPGLVQHAEFGEGHDDARSPECGLRL